MGGPWERAKLGVLNQRALSHLGRVPLPCALEEQGCKEGVGADLLYHGLCGIHPGG